MKKILTLATTLALFSAPAVAQENSDQFEGAYAGAMIGYNSYSLGILDEKVSGMTFGGLIGYRYKVSSHFLIGLEGYVNSNQANKDFFIDPIIVNVSSDASYGVNGTLGIAGDYIMSYVMVGFGWNDLSASAGDITVSDSDNGLHLAGGAEFKLSESLHLRAQVDWQDFDGASSLGGSAGLIVKF